MKFKEAFIKMLDGKAVRRPHWSGYWTWEDNTIKMYLKSGDVLDVRNMKSVAETMLNVAEEDWETCRPRIVDPNFRIGVRGPRRSQIERDISVWG